LYEGVDIQTNISYEETEVVLTGKAKTLVELIESVTYELLPNEEEEVIEVDNNIGFNELEPDFD